MDEDMPTDDGRNTEEQNSCSAEDALPATRARTHRRKLLASVAAGGSLSLTGCLGLYSFGTPPEEWDRRPEIDTEEESDSESPDEEGEGEGEGEGSDDDAGGTYDVRYLKQEETIEVPNDQSLLVAGEEQGWDLPYQCRRGICGTCTARLWGEARELVEMDGNEFLTDEEIDDGFVLTCVGYPRSDFTLVTGEREALDR